MTIPGARLAALLDMTPTRLRQLVQEGVIPPPPKRGEYHFTASIQAYVKHLRERAVGRPGSTSATAADLAAETLKWRRTRRQRAEYELERVQGKHVDVDLVGAVVFELHREGRDRLQSLPSRQAAAVAARLACEVQAVREVLEDVVREHLAETPAPDLVARVRAKTRGRDAA